jgi:hypothetical protein
VPEHHQRSLAPNTNCHVNAVHSRFFQTARHACLIVDCIVPLTAC